MTCKHGTPFERFCDLCKSECFTVPPKPAVPPATARIPIIRGNIASLCRNEARALGWEIGNDVLAQMAVLDALGAVLGLMAAEWKAAEWGEK